MSKMAQTSYVVNSKSEKLASLKKEKGEINPGEYKKKWQEEMAGIIDDKTLTTEVKAEILSELLVKSPGEFSNALKELNPRPLSI